MVCGSGPLPSATTGYTMDDTKKSIIKTASNLIIAVGAILAVFWGINEHYAKAADFERYQQQQNQRFDQYQREQKQALVELRKRALEDELFDLNWRIEKGSGGAFERAKRARILRELDDLR